MDIFFWLPFSSSFLISIHNLNNLPTYQESIAADFLEKLIDWSKNIKISDPMEEGCRLGAIVSKGQV
jgi:hypothetical protein